LGVFRIVEPNLAAGAIVVVDNVAHFPTELRPIVERLSHAPYRATQLLLGSGTARSIGLDARTRFLEPLRAGLVRGEVGEDRDQFGRVAAPRVVDSDVGVLDGPAGRHDVPGWHGQRPARIAVEGREIGPAALLDGAQFVAGLPPQAESVRDLASRIAQARERKPIAPLRLQAVVRRLCETTNSEADLASAGKVTLLGAHDIAVAFADYLAAH